MRNDRGNGAAEDSVMGVIMGSPGLVQAFVQNGKVKRYKLEAQDSRSRSSGPCLPCDLGQVT